MPTPEVIAEHEISAILVTLQGLHRGIRNRVLEACERMALDDLARASDEQAGDTIYAIDRVSERELLEFLEPRAAGFGGLVLIAEGIEGGERVLPRGHSEAEARFRLIVDPIDGTRGLMYQKRSGWVLSAIAPNRGSATALSDVLLAVQTEIPLLKQHLSDNLWASRRGGVSCERYDRVRDQTVPIRFSPSRAPSIEHGFASLARFFPGVRDELSAIDDEVAFGVLGAPQPGKALCFEDQYACTGGQLYELACGHDRFIADLRPLFGALLAARGLPLGLCCHPYDICTALIAEKLGVELTDGLGAPLNPPLDVSTNVSWVGYANAQIRARVEPVLERALNKRHIAFGRAHGERRALDGGGPDTK